MGLDALQQARLNQYAREQFGTEPPGDAEDADKGQQEPHRTHKNASTAIVSTLSYLIGVPKDSYEKFYLLSVYNQLERDEDAKVIRSLCTIRNALLRHSGRINDKLRREVANLDSIPEYIDPEHFRFLEQNKIRIVTGTQVKPITEYLISVNNHISNRVGSVLRLFPVWLNTAFIRNVLVMPDGSRDSVVLAAIAQMKENLANYPFSCYINWPVTRADAYIEDPENYLNPTPSGNVLLNDRRFMVLLYRINGQTFTEFHRVSDADADVKSRVIDFMTRNERIAMLVDCENSDPYKLCAVMDFLREERASALRNGDEMRPGEIVSATLYDDYHTVDAWDILREHVGVPIAHEEVERVLGHKSLVDIEMTIGACRAYFTEGIRAFILVSSDSDYCPLMRSMPDADFMMLTEESKLSRDTVEFFEQRGVVSCPMDGFSANLTKIKESALLHGVEKRLGRAIAVNLDEMMSDIAASLRLSLTPKEMENNRVQVLRRMRVDVSADGDLSIRL